MLNILYCCIHSSQEEGHLSYKCPKNLLGEREPPPKKKKKRKYEDDDDEENQR